MRSESSRRGHTRTLLGLLAAIAGCTQLVSVEGPPPPASPTISSVVVTPLETEGKNPKALTDRARVQEILSSYAFSKDGWVRPGARRLVPLYRIDLRSDEDMAFVYWLGANSHPPQFPCYALCTGWWLAASGPSGDLDVTRYKLLPESVSLSLLRDLQVP